MSDKDKKRAKIMTEEDKGSQMGKGSGLDYFEFFYGG